MGQNPTDQVPVRRPMKLNVMKIVIIIFSCSSNSMPTLVTTTSSIFDPITFFGRGYVMMVLDLEPSIPNQTKPSWPTYLPDLPDLPDLPYLSTLPTFLTYLPDLPTSDLPTWPTWLDSQLWHNLFQSVQCRTQFFTNVVFVEYLVFSCPSSSIPTLLTDWLMVVT